MSGHSISAAGPGDGSPLAITARVVTALLLRETRVRFGRSQIGYLWAVLEPLGGVLIIASVFHVIGRIPDVGRSLYLFLALGMLGYSIQRRLAVQLGSAFEANQALLTFPIVKRVDVLLARGILQTQYLFPAGSLPTPLLAPGTFWALLLLAEPRRTPPLKPQFQALFTRAVLSSPRRTGSHTRRASIGERDSPVESTTVACRIPSAAFSVRGSTS